MFALVIAMVAVNVMEADASPAPKEKAESYQNVNLKAVHPTKVEITIKKEEPKKKEGGNWVFPPSHFSQRGWATAYCF